MKSSFIAVHFALKVNRYGETQAGYLPQARSITLVVPPESLPPLQGVQHASRHP